MKILELLFFFENELEKQNYSQFTIDFIQNKIIEFDELENIQELEDDLKKSLSYEVSNIIEIMKQGKDIELFNKFYKYIHNE